MKKYIFAGLTGILLAAGLVFSFNSHGNISVDANASEFAVATYNVENLFDMKADGTEYAEYIPNFKGWTKTAYEIKLSNIAKVIKDMNAAVVALEEVENENALNDLLAKLAKDGAPYPYHAITKAEKSAVQSVLISRFKILSYEELKVGNHRGERPILKAKLEVGNNELIIYVNHWKAKTGPESRRIEFARTLVADIRKLPDGADFLVLGDFNSNYNEMETFTNDKKLNDTSGITGINNILKTAKSNPNTKLEMASKADVVVQNGNELLYNLWMELPKFERISEWFGKEKNTPDNIIIPKAMFDKKGISYEDGSFKVFSPPYLFKNGRPYRWENNNGIPQGYSDHLPLIAKFTSKPFEAKEEPKKIQADSKGALKEIKISDIYADNVSGNVDFLIKNGIVIYKNQNGLILKQKGGRAIYVYNAPTDMELGGIYDVRVSKIDDFKGLKEIKNIVDKKRVGADNVKDYYLRANGIDLSNASIQNEVVTGVEGVVSKGKFVYDGGKPIKIYFKDKEIKPKSLTKIRLLSAHAAFFNEPQIVIYKSDDFQTLE